MNSYMKQFYWDTWRTNSLFLSVERMVFNISSSVVWAKIKSIWFLFLKYYVGDMMDIFVSDWSYIAKKLLKELLIFLWIFNNIVTFQMKWVWKYNIFNINQFLSMSFLSCSYYFQSNLTNCFESYLSIYWVSKQAIFFFSLYSLFLLLIFFILELTLDTLF